MKRLIILLLIVALAGFGVWKYTKTDKYSTLGKDNDFAVKDTARISRIFLADRKGNTASLTRKGKSWMVNNRYRVNDAVMGSFMNTIYGLETQFRPPQAAINTMVKNLAAQSIKTEIYNDKNELIRSYYVGGVTPDESGTYMIMEGEEQPFIVGVKGKDGGIKVSYFTNEENWRDKAVFRIGVDQIKSVELEYPKLKNKSFKLVKTETGYEVSPLNTSVPKIAKPLNKSRVEAFLVGFKSQVAEALYNNSSEKASIIQTLPFCIFNVEDVNGIKKNVKLYPLIKTNRDGRLILDENGNPLPIEKYYAYVDDKDFFIVQEGLFGKIMWAYDYFF